MGGFITPAILDQIRTASDIVDIISAVVPLKKAGASFVALCPFHREKSPSFHVNARKQTFHCFGCGKGGDVFTFIKEYESLDFVEAVKRLADRARIPLQFDNDPQHREKQFLKDKLLEIHEQITQRWQGCLNSDAAGERARNYLKERGVSDEGIKLFRLGYAPESWDDTVNWAKSKGYDFEVLEQSGIVVRKDGSDHYYGRFRDRLIFPICDEQGRVIGFSGRILPGDDDPRKYVNSPETPLFTKSRVMFGLDKAKRSLLEKQFAIICEGQLDLIACYMAGVQNIVAPQGTALTRDHTRILKRYVSEVVLCFDSDEAGQKAAVRALDDVLGSGMAVRVATIPAPDDPDSFIKKNGAEAFQELIRTADGFFDYYLNRLCQLNNIATDRGQKQVISSMAEAVQKANDPALLDKYAQKTAARLGLSALNAARLFKSAQKVQSYAPEPFVPDAIPDDGSWRPNTHEYWFLKILLLEDERLELARAHLNPDWIQNQCVREVLEYRLRLNGVEQPLEPAAILDFLREAPRSRTLVTEALAEDRAIPNTEQQLLDLLTTLRNGYIDREIARVDQRMASPGIEAEESIQLLRHRTDLKNLKRSAIAGNGVGSNPG
ncbi:MAG: DNA primase [Verrucomicrobiota bacterium]